MWQHWMWSRRRRYCFDPDSPVADSHAVRPSAGNLIRLGGDVQGDGGMCDRNALIRELIAVEAPVHMAGIGGVGMAGLALLLRARGVPVSGCDLQQGAFVEGLKRAGVPVCMGHGAEQVASVDWMIRSAAVREEQPDVQGALARGLPVFRRGEVLAALVRLALQSVAVAGTHGKTTTTTLVAQLLGALDPSWCIGGVSAAYPMPGGAGAGPLVVEADESDGTLALYAPQVAVVTNVDFDHMEHFPSVAAFESCFRAFLGQAGDAVVYCVDDARARVLGRAAGCRAIGYGFDAGADVRGTWDGSRVLGVAFPGGGVEELALPPALPGRHNALNLLGALAVCYALGVPSGVWRERIAGLRLPSRRYETLAVCGGVQVVSDYAHHPAEIAVLVQMARLQHSGRVLVVFQPHRYSRTLAFGKDFPLAFQGVDWLVLTPVYAASEPRMPGGTSEDLLASFVAADCGYDTVLAGDLAAAADLVLERVRAGDLVLIVGAGDVEGVGRIVADAIRGLNATDK